MVKFLGHPHPFQHYISTCGDSQKYMFCQTLKEWRWKKKKPQWSSMSYRVACYSPGSGGRGPGAGEVGVRGSYVGKQLSSRRAPVLTFSFNHDTGRTHDNGNSPSFKSAGCLTKKLLVSFFCNLTRELSLCSRTKKGKDQHCFESYSVTTLNSSLVPEDCRPP